MYTRNVNCTYIAKENKIQFWFRIEFMRRPSLYSVSIIFNMCLIVCLFFIKLYRTEPQCTLNLNISHGQTIKRFHYFFEIISSCFFLLSIRNKKLVKKSLSISAQAPSAIILVMCLFRLLFSLCPDFTGSCPSMNVV